MNAIASVPVISSTSVLISMVLMILIPIIAIIVLHYRYHANIWLAFIGALAFFMIVMGLEGGINAFIISSPIGSFIQSNPFIFTLYGALMAALFEEVGRYFVIKGLSSRIHSVSDGVSYGLGYGCMEAVLIAGLSLLSTYMMMSSVNDGSIFMMVNENISLQQVEEIIYQLTTTPFWMYFLSLLERLLVISIQVCFTTFMIIGLFKKNIKYAFIAFGVHFVIDIFAGFINTGIFLILGLGELMALFTLYSVITLCLIIMGIYLKNECKSIKFSEE